MDKDFTRLHRYSPKDCGGIILVKIYRRTVDETLTLFKGFYEKIKEEDFKDNLVVISPEGVRIRRPIQ